MKKVAATTFLLLLATLCCSLNEQCETDNGEQGICIDTADCTPTGTSFPGFCPGPVNIQCCVNETTPDSCTTDTGYNGVCISTETCLGSSVPGFCPGPIQIQCCVNETTVETCTANSVEGVCRDIAFCDGTSTPGFCPNAPTSIQCCTDETTPSPVVTPSAGVTGCQVSQYNGECQSASTCSGISVAGYCPGPSDIQCCIEFPGDSFLPQLPTDSGSSCTTPYNSYSGECINIADCTGATFNGLCPGSSQIKCCVAETQPVTNIEGKFTLNQSVFETVFTGISSTRATAMRPYFNFGVTVVTIDAETDQVACLRIAAFIAQLGYESGGLKYFEEIASGAAYEGRLSLGNTEPGDGMRFKGRGPIQLTGRSNYRSAGGRLGLDLEADPESVCFPSLGFMTSVDYWINRNLNNYASTDDYDDFRELTRRINGGYNGLDGRNSRWETAKSILQCSAASTTIITGSPTVIPTAAPTSTPMEVTPSSSPSTVQVSASPTEAAEADELAGQIAVVSVASAGGLILLAVAAILVRRRMASSLDAQVIETKYPAFSAPAVTPAPSQHHYVSRPPGL